MLAGGGVAPSHHRVEHRHVARAQIGRFLVARHAPAVVGEKRLHTGHLLQILVYLVGVGNAHDPRCVQVHRRHRLVGQAQEVRVDLRCFIRPITSAVVVRVGIAQPGYGGQPVVVGARGVVIVVNHCRDEQPGGGADGPANGKGSALRVAPHLREVVDGEHRQVVAIGHDQANIHLIIPQLRHRGSRLLPQLLHLNP